MANEFTCLILFSRRQTQFWNILNCRIKTTNDKEKSPFELLYLVAKLVQFLHTSRAIVNRQT